MNINLEATLRTLSSYVPLDRKNRKENNELLALRIQENNGDREESLIKINSSDVTFWNLFLRIFNRGVLAHTHISIKNIENHLFRAFESPSFKEEHKMDCDSQAYKTTCKIRDWAEMKGYTRLNQFVSSFQEFKVWIKGNPYEKHYTAPYEIRHTFDAPIMHSNSILDCEKKLEEEAFQKRQYTISELGKYYLGCTDIVRFHASENYNDWEQFFTQVKITVGPAIGEYIPGSFRYQLAKILKPSNHQANVRRTPGKIVDPHMENALTDVDVQRFLTLLVTGASTEQGLRTFTS